MRKLLNVGEVTALSTAVVMDHKLSLAAKGLFAVLRSLGAIKSVSMAELGRMTGSSVGLIRKTLGELDEAGLIADLSKDNDTLMVFPLPLFLPLIPPLIPHPREGDGPGTKYSPPAPPMGGGRGLGRGVQGERNDETMTAKSLPLVGSAYSQWVKDLIASYPGNWTLTNVQFMGICSAIRARMREHNLSLADVANMVAKYAAFLKAEQSAYGWSPLTFFRDYQLMTDHDGIWRKTFHRKTKEEFQEEESERRHRELIDG